MLKKINISCGEKGTALVANITHVEKDKSSLRCDLYATARRIETVTSDTVTETDRILAKWQPHSLLEERRTFLKADLPFAFSLADYEYFYPKVVVVSDADKLAAEITDVENQIDVLVAKLKVLKGD